MLVPVVVAASVSPVKNPLVIDTVADARFGLSTSLTVVPADNVVGGPSERKRQTPPHCRAPAGC